MFDPRITVLEHRLSQVNNIFAVSSGKGGVGKSVIASVLALILARKGFKVGLMDLDFTSPSTHLILGVKDIFPKEKEGIVPPTVYGIKFMSIVYFSKDKALSLRGQDFSDSFLEILAITRWGNLDYLILDMPPGINDATLDVVRFMKRVKFIIVTTPSLLSFSTVKKLLDSLHTSKVEVLGIIENMKIENSSSIREHVKGTRFLGEIPFDPQLEKCFGEVRELLSTEISRKLEKIVDKIIYQNV
ncbi:MAG: ATP-binding protein [Nitrososphaeria archaeon]|nr:ATP-binding protein [Nitrososphaeria archaeon]